jgi:hypothetical protein
MLHTNVHGTENVVNAAIETGVKKIIHVSSIAALGNNEMISEETKWDRKEKSLMLQQQIVTSISTQATVQNVTIIETAEDMASLVHNWQQAGLSKLNDLISVGAGYEDLYNTTHSILSQQPFNAFA